MSWSGHPAETIVANRRNYFAKMGLDGNNAVAADQTHGTRAYIVKKADAGKGIWEPSTRLSGTDAMMTNESGMILTTLHADCAPIYYADPDHKVIALVHAGWRGILSGIAGQILERMTEEFGSDPGHVLAAVGPMVSASAYEADFDLIRRFIAAYGPEVFFQKSGHSYLDLFAAIMADLVQNGFDKALRPERPPCTSLNPEYSSYRRDGSPPASMMAWLTIE